SPAQPAPNCAACTNTLPLITSSAAPAISTHATYSYTAVEKSTVTSPSFSPSMKHSTSPDAPLTRHTTTSAPVPATVNCVGFAAAPNRHCLVPCAHATTKPSPPTVARLNKMSPPGGTASTCRPI